MKYNYFSTLQKMNKWIVNLEPKSVGKTCTFMQFETHQNKIVVEVNLNSQKVANRFSNNDMFDEDPFCLKQQNRLYINFFGDRDMIEQAKQVAIDINYTKIIEIRSRFSEENPFDDDEIYPPDRICCVPFTISDKEEENFYIGLDLFEHLYVEKFLNNLSRKCEVLNTEGFVSGYNEIKSRV